jgi:hypothetical protein
VRDARQHAALAAALLIGGQLLLGYWFYSYLTWWYPLLVIAVIQARPDHEASSAPRGRFRTVGGRSGLGMRRTAKTVAELAGEYCISE